MTAAQLRINTIRTDTKNYAGPKRLLDYIEELCKMVESTKPEKQNANHTQKAD